MQIAFSPVYGPPPMTLHREGDVLTINGLALDFGPLTEGAILPAAATGCDLVTGKVTRITGVLHLTLILPWGDGAPVATRFPAPMTLTGDGPVTLPPYDGSEP